MFKYNEAFAFVINLLLAMTLIVVAIKKSDVKTMLSGMGDTCEVKPTDADLEAILLHDRNPPKSAKCFKYCILNQTKLITSDNKLDLDIGKQLFAMAYEDGEEIGGQLVTACNTRVHDEEMCEKSHNYGLCFIDELSAKNISIEKLEE